MMEHEMRLAVLPYFGDDARPMVMPYCTGCGWVGERHYTFAAESISAEWRAHVKEFNESEDRPECGTCSGAGKVDSSCYGQCGYMVACPDCGGER